MSSLLPVSNNRGTGGIRFKTLVQPGAIISPLVLTRSQLTGVQSTAIASDGSIVQTYGADVARFNGSARRLLIEGQRINVITNPRIIGGTGWTTGSGGSISASSEISPNGTQDAFLFNATATGYGSVFETTSVTAVQPYTLSVYAKAGNSNILGLEFRGQTSAPNATFNLSNGTVASGSGTIVSAGNGWWRCSITVTSGDASELAIISAGNSGAAGRTIHLWRPQCELGAFASTPILPPVGMPGSSTRGTDLASTALTSLAISANGACTVLSSALFPLNNSIAGAQGFFSLSDGTNLNRLFVRSGTGNTIVINNSESGVSPTVVSTINTWTAGTVFRLGIVALGNGTVKAILNNGTIITQGGGPLSGLTTLRIGSDASGSTPMFGEIHTLRILPYALPDSALAAYVAALPI